MEVGELIAGGLRTQGKGKFAGLRAAREELSEEFIAELEGKRDAPGGSSVLGDDPIPQPRRFAELRIVARKNADPEGV